MACCDHDARVQRLLTLDCRWRLRQTRRRPQCGATSRLTKLLLIVVGLFVAYWIIKRYKKKVERRERRDERPAANEDMVRCAQCGVHLPRSESLTTRNAFYCSADHARAHENVD